MDIEYTTLYERPEYFNQVIKLIENEFGYTEKHSLKIDFAPLFKKENFKNLHIALYNDELVGHVGAKSKTIGPMSNNVPACLFGGLTISKKYQGKGHFRNFFEYVMDLYEEDHAIFLLWSDKIDLYRKFDFVELGVIIQTPGIEEKSFSHKSFKKDKLKNLSEQQFNQIKEIYKKEFEDKLVTILRSNEDWEDIKNISSIDLHYQEENDVITSYILEGKGHDLQNTCHEVCISNKELLSEIANENKIWLYIDQLGQDSIPDNTDVIYGTLLKIANHHSFSSYVEKIGDKKIDIQGYSQDMLQIFLDDKEYHLYKEDFLRGIFGPEFVTEFGESIPPIFISGADSI